MQLAVLHASGLKVLRRAPDLQAELFLVSFDADVLRPKRLQHALMLRCYDILRHCMSAILDADWKSYAALRAAVHQPLPASGRDNNGSQRMDTNMFLSGLWEGYYGLKQEGFCSLNELLDT